MTQTFDAALGSWNDFDPMTATATMSIQVPTCVRPGDVIVPILTATLTAPGFEEAYSGRGLNGYFRFMYWITGAVVGSQRRNVRIAELALHRDTAGNLGLRVSVMGPSETVADTGDVITVGANPLALDTYFGDWEHEFYATQSASVPPLGTITVASA